MKNVVILGATSYHEISELINDINSSQTLESDKINVVGLLDDNEELLNTTILEKKVLGTLDAYKKFDDDTFFVFGIGSHKTHLTRHNILDRLKIPGSRFISLIHPSSKIFSTAKIDYGCIIHCNSVIFNNTYIAPFTIIMACSVIGAYNIVGEGCCITSQVVTTSGVKIGNYSFIGVNSSIGENVEISPGCIISMNSLVTKNTKSGELRFGVPSKKIHTKSVDNKIIKNWEILRQKTDL